MAKIDQETTCPHCHKDTLFLELPEDYCAKRWNRADLDAYPRVQCQECGATFRKAALEAHLDNS